MFSNFQLQRTQRECEKLLPPLRCNVYKLVPLFNSVTVLLRLLLSFRISAVSVSDGEISTDLLTLSLETRFQSCKCNHVVVSKVSKEFQIVPDQLWIYPTCHWGIRITYAYYCTMYSSSSYRVGFGSVYHTKSPTQRWLISVRSPQLIWVFKRLCISSNAPSSGVPTDKTRSPVFCDFQPIEHHPWL